VYIFFKETKPLGFLHTIFNILKDLACYCCTQQGSDGELEEGEHETTDQSTDGELDDVCRFFTFMLCLNGSLVVAEIWLCGGT